MRFPYALIALFGLTSTVLGRNDGPPRHPQCPATQATRQVNNNDAYGQTTPPPESRVGEGSSSQCDRSSQACTEQSATRANSESRARQRSHGNAIRGSTRKPETKNARVTFRRPLPARSYLYYRHRRHVETLLEFESQQQRQAFLARRQHLIRLASKYGYGYKLKVGNYQIGPGRARMIWI